MIFTKFILAIYSIGLAFIFHYASCMNQCKPLILGPWHFNSDNKSGIWANMLDAKFSSDGTHLLIHCKSSSSCSNIIIVGVDREKQINPLAKCYRFDSIINEYTINPNNLFLACTYLDCHVSIRNLTNEDVVSKKIKLKNSPQKRITEIAFSPTNRDLYLVSRSLTGIGNHDSKNITQLLSMNIEDLFKRKKKVPCKLIVQTTPHQVDDWPIHVDSDDILTPYNLVQNNPFSYISLTKPNFTKNLTLWLPKNSTQLQFSPSAKYIAYYCEKTGHTIINRKGTSIWTSPPQQGLPPKLLLFEQYENCYTILQTSPTTLKIIGILQDLEKYENTIITHSPIDNFVCSPNGANILVHCNDNTTVIHKNIVISKSLLNFMRNKERCDVTIL